MSREDPIADSWYDRCPANIEREYRYSVLLADDLSRSCLACIHRPFAELGRYLYFVPALHDKIAGPHGQLTYTVENEMLLPKRGAGQGLHWCNRFINVVPRSTIIWSLAVIRAEARTKKAARMAPSEAVQKRFSAIIQ